MSEMSSMYFVSFVVALCLSMVFMPLLIKHSARLGLVDDPTEDARKLHGEVMPRSGGLAIVLATAFALLLVLPVDTSLATFLVASLVIIAFGVWDDRASLSPSKKLVGQMLGVAIAMAGGMTVHDVPLLPDTPLWLANGVAFVFVLGVINAVNFSDGMDGLAAGVSLMALVLLFALAAEAGDLQVATIALAVAAGVLGFLRFNTHPARIFMGDAGSQFLGFAIAWLAIVLSQRDTTPITTLMPLLVLGLPVLDLLQVVPLRLSQGRRPWQPDRQNFHHQVADLGLKHDEAVAVIYVLQALLIAGAWSLRYATDSAVIGAYAVFAGSVITGLWLMRRKGWSLRDPQVAEPGPYRRNPIFRRLSFLHSYTGYFFGIAITVFLGASALAADLLPRLLVVTGIAWAGLLCAACWYGRDRWSLSLGRLAAYTATPLLVYGLTRSLESEVLNVAVDGLLIAMSLLLMLAIRIARREYFWLTTQDLLVLLFVVILVPQVPVLFDADFTSDSLIFRTCVVLYTCEYVLAHGKLARRRLTLALAGALALLGVHSL